MNIDTFFDNEGATTRDALFLVVPTLPLSRGTMICNIGRALTEGRGLRQIVVTSDQELKRTAKGFAKYSSSRDQVRLALDEHPDRVSRLKDSKVKELEHLIFREFRHDQAFDSPA